MAETEIHDPLLQQLRDERLLTPQQVEDITDEHERTGKPVRQLLMDLGLLTEDQILGVIARVLGVRKVRLRDLDILPDVIRAVPVSVVRMYNMIPVETGPNSVVLATSELPSTEVNDELQFVLTRDVAFVVMP
ncbi:MAG: pilus assembly protein PilB, partial [Kiritimatiellaeota bacterium]|nr:pilus assembly protein PilB [Kiritimatiellota bacterium]